MVGAGNLQATTLIAAGNKDYQSYLAGMVTLAFICFLAVNINYLFFLTPYHITLFDIASGVATGLLIVYGCKYWPAVFVGMLSAYFTNGETFAYTVSLSICVTLEAFIAAYLVRYYLDNNFGLDYIPDLLKYFVIVTLVMVGFGSVSHSFILTLFKYDELNNLGFLWLNTSLAKIMGVMVITPFIMVWSQKLVGALSWSKLIELACLLCALFLFTGLIFLGWFDANISGYSRYPLAYMLFPILAWAAFRFGQRVSTLATIIIATFALLSLLNGLGPFSRDSIYQSHFLTWLCINTASILSMILAADITYCKKVRVALQKSDERLDLATSGSQDGLWDWPDVKSDEMWWSPNFFQLLDYSENEITQSHKQLINLMHPDDRENHRKALKNHIEKGDIYNIDFRIQTKSQGYRWFHAKAESTIDSSTRNKRMAGSIIDIDDRKIAQNEITKLNRNLEKRVIERTNQLEDKNKDLQREILERNKAELEIVKLQNDLIRIGRVMTMGEMTSALAHELHQPLMAIVNYSQSTLVDLERDNNTQNNEVVKNIELISQQALRGGEIIRNMKEFTKRGKTEYERFDLNEIIIQLKPLFNIEVVQNNINFKIELEKKEMIVNINHIQIQQVISNLVKNSIEAMKYNTAEKNLVIKTFKKDSDTAVIEVIDNGAGLSEESIDIIFDSFYTTKSEGLGLGLSISQKIIKAHEGCLKLFNNEYGATARIEFNLSMD